MRQLSLPTSRLSKRPLLHHCVSTTIVRARNIPCTGGRVLSTLARPGKPGQTATPKPSLRSRRHRRSRCCGAHASSGEAQRGKSEACAGSLWLTAASTSGARDTLIPRAPSWALEGDSRAQDALSRLGHGYRRISAGRQRYKSPDFAGPCKAGLLVSATPWMGVLDAEWGNRRVQRAALRRPTTKAGPRSASFLALQRQPIPPLRTPPTLRDEAVGAGRN